MANTGNRRFTEKIGYIPSYHQTPPISNPRNIKPCVTEKPQINTAEKKLGRPTPDLNSRPLESIGGPPCLTEKSLRSVRSWKQESCVGPYGVRNKGVRGDVRQYLTAIPVINRNPRFDIFIIGFREHLDLLGGGGNRALLHSPLPCPVGGFSFLILLAFILSFGSCRNSATFCSLEGKKYSTQESGFFTASGLGNGSLSSRPLLLNQSSGSINGARPLIRSMAHPSMIASIS